jgi:hypothetical protein
VPTKEAEELSNFLETAAAESCVSGVECSSGVKGSSYSVICQILGIDSCLPCVSIYHVYIVLAMYIHSNTYKYNVTQICTGIDNILICSMRTSFYLLY